MTGNHSTVGEEEQDRMLRQQKHEIDKPMKYYLKRLVSWTGVSSAANRILPNPVSEVQDHQLHPHPLLLLELLLDWELTLLKSQYTTL